MDNDCFNNYNCRDCPVSKLRDIFASIENLMPLAYLGTRVQLLYKTRAPELSANRATPDNFDADARWWSAASVFKVNTGGPKPGIFWISTTYDIRFRHCSTSTMVELNPRLGNWNFETVNRFCDGYLDLAVAGQVCAWTVPHTAQFNVDFNCKGRTISASTDPILKQFSVQFLQAVSSRVLVGGELKFQMDRSRNYMSGLLDVKSMCVQPSVLFKYAGPQYLISGQFNPLKKTVKMGHYRHCSEKIQTGAMIFVDMARSTAITRLMFRILSDSSVFRAAIGTDGIINSLWEKRIGQRFSLSLSAILSRVFKNYGMGIGLSFEM